MGYFRGAAVEIPHFYFVNGYNQRNVFQSLAYILNSDSGLAASL